MKKNLLALILISVLVFSLAGCNSQTSSNTEDVSSLKIGVVAPMSGQSAIAGEYIKNGISLAVDELEEAGGLDRNGKKIQIEVIYEDNEAKPDMTSNAYRKLIEQDKVIAIVGPDMSGAILAAGPIAQQAKIPAIGTFTTNEKVTQVGDFVFRACFIDPFQGKVMAQYAYNDLGARTASILYNNADDFSTGLKESFVKNFEELGGEVIEIQAYGGAEVKDYSAQLTRIKAANADVIFLPNLFGELPLQVKQAREMGITTQIIGGDSFDSPDVPNIAGKELVEGIAFPAAFSPTSDDPVTKDFVDRYVEKFGVNPNSNAVLAYEAFKIVLKGIQEAETLDGQGVRDAMAAIKDFQLPSGNFSFDENRNPVKSASIMVYKDGIPTFETVINP